MSLPYDHKEIEKKWQKKWEEQKLYAAPDSAAGKDNLYTLVEFVYPSGNLHAGHWYAFSVPDIYVRMKRMEGKNALYPMGFDAFGLPAENAAIKNGADPAKWTLENIDKMRAQLKSMGASFDWNREVITCNPDYYKWTQWLFLKLYEKGLAYRGKALVNWDPVDMTVLANEQVLPDGTAERSGAKVEKKELEQWFLKITDYADRLIDDLESLDWPKPIKEAQKNWIGRSAGAEIDFPISGSDEKITVFTTRADTLFGGTFLVLAPEHPFVKKCVPENITEVENYVVAAARKSELERLSVGKEKTGAELRGIKAINPTTGALIPIWIADYAIAHFGTGALFGDAHDERDVAFARKFGIPLKPTLRPADREDDSAIRNLTEIFEGKGILFDSGEFSGLTSDEALSKIITKFGRKKTTYKLRDWLISRQRYWGAPIPIVYDPEGKAHAVPAEHLPWMLPTDVDFTPTGVAPLARSKELLERTEKIFGKGWKPEVDTMDVFVDSSWYFLRYLDAKNVQEFSNLEKQKAWMPVNRYSGGSEHTTVHVLYSRFFYKALFDMGLATESEPYKVRMNRGIILAEDGRKMSKRWGNTVNPDEQVENVGADAMRTYLAFIGPYNEVGSFPWSTNSLIGVRRFLERVAGFSEKVSDVEPSDSLSILTNQTIKKVEDDIEGMKFNTCVSAVMILSNELQKLDKIPRKTYEILLVLLAPFAPHLMEELWEKLGHETSIHLEKWPQFDVSKLETDMATIAIQVGGKTRGTVTVPRGASQDAVLLTAQGEPRLAAHLPVTHSRIVFVAGKILNIIP